ncbi:LysR family transcriptional regulator [Burkholderia gladioli]|uniref:LysR family transcriptional regulator n=1 Tax=Burkholderia gladioli TaxID=28095 RepID=UPI00163EEAA2|nr:LysR family transcriptional regulator [Burkholderia gladioli]
MLDDDPLISERTLAYLEAVATHGSMRGAADSLDVNVSTVSRQIALLQRQLRLPLVSRKGRSVALTEVGLAMVDYHRERERNARRFRQQLQDYRALRRGRLTIGVAEGFVAEFVGGVLKPFSQRFPDITLELRSAPLSELIRLVREDQVDICLAVGLQRDPALQMRRIQSDPLCAIVPRGHRLARRNTIAIGDLADQDLVFLEPQFAVQQHLDAMLDAERLVLTPRFRCDRFSTTLLLAAEGLGIAFMTRRAASREIARGEVRAIPLNHPIARGFDRYVITRAGRRLPPAGNHLWKEIVRVLSAA